MPTLQSTSADMAHKLLVPTFRERWVSYFEYMKGNRGNSPDNEIAELLPKKHGQPLLLGKNVDEQVQLYLA